MSLDRALLLALWMRLEWTARIVAARYPHHFADFYAEDGDANTADVFVQCCVFEMIKYG